MSHHRTDDPSSELDRLRMVVSQAFGLTNSGASAQALQLLQEEKRRAEALAAAGAEHGAEVLERWERTLHRYRTYYGSGIPAEGTERQPPHWDESFDPS